MNWTQDQGPPKRLFDERAQALRVDRARRRQARQTSFLQQRVIDDLAERLLDVNRTFSRACLVGPFDWRGAVINSLPNEKRFLTFDWQTTPKDGSYDLIISLLHLQSVNEVGGWMQAIRKQLKPDGLFIASLIGGTSFSNLRQALYAIDTNRLGSPSPRIHPMIEVRAAAQLLGHVGLAIPVTDSDRFTVHYRKITTFADDLRDVGLTNSLAHRDRQMVPGLLKDLETHLRTAQDEPIPVQFEIVWMAGWAPHESQQKPLKPGSAKIGLNQALKSIRDES